MAEGNGRGPTTQILGGGGGDDRHRLIGSVQWQRRQESRAAMENRRRDEAKELLRLYRFLPEMEVTRINTSGETETGKALHPSLVNRLELTIALNFLPDTQRRCLILFTMEDMSYAEIARARRCSEESVRQNVSRAVRSCRDRVYDRGMVA